MQSLDLSRFHFALPLSNKTLQTQTSWNLSQGFSTNSKVLFFPVPSQALFCFTWTNFPTVICISSSSAGLILHSFASQKTHLNLSLLPQSLLPHLRFQESSYLGLHKHCFNNLTNPQRHDFAFHVPYLNEILNIHHPCLLLLYFLFLFGSEYHGTFHAGILRLGFWHTIFSFLVLNFLHHRNFLLHFGLKEIYSYNYVLPQSIRKNVSILSQWSSWIPITSCQFPFTLFPKSYSSGLQFRRSQIFRNLCFRVLIFCWIHEHKHSQS